MPTIRIDDEVMVKLKEAAVRHGLVFGTPNEVLRRDYGIDTPESRDTEQYSGLPNEELCRGVPSSDVREVQYLLEGLLQKVKEFIGFNPTFDLSKNGRWVASPDKFFTIKIQDSRVRNLSITVYGKPEDFGDIDGSLNIQPDRPSYSRFNLDTPNQVHDSANVISRAFQLKLNRKR